MTTVNKPSAPRPSTFAITMMCAVVGLFYGYEFMLRVYPSVILHDLVQRFQASIGTVGLIASAYYTTYTPMQLLVGVLLDRFGVRTLTVVAILSCVMGTWLFDHTSVLSVGHIGRALVGFGSAFAFVAVLKVAAEWLPERWYGLVSGVATSVGMLGAVSGEWLLAHAFDRYGMEKVGQAYVLAGLMLAGLAFMVLRDRLPRKQRPTGLQMVQQLGIDLWHVVRIKQLWHLGVVGGLLYTSTTLFADLWGVSYLTHDVHLTAVKAASVTVWTYLGWVVGSPLFGWLASRGLPVRHAFLLGAMVALLASLLLLLNTVHHLPSLRTLAFLIGVGCSAEILAFSSSLVWVKRQAAATAVALVNCVVMFSGFMQPVIGWFIDHLADQPLHVGMTLRLTGHQWAMSMLPLCFFMAMFLTWLWIPSNPSPPSTT